MKHLITHYLDCTPSAWSATTAAVDSEVGCATELVSEEDLGT